MLMLQAWSVYHDKYETSGVLRLTPCMMIKTSIFLVMYYKSFFNCSHGNISKGNIVVINQTAWRQVQTGLVAKRCWDNAFIMISK